jgi:hypothetical protein
MKLLFISIIDFALEFLRFKTLLLFLQNVMTKIRRCWNFIEEKSQASFGYNTSYPKWKAKSNWNLDWKFWFLGHSFLEKFLICFLTFSNFDYEWILDFQLINNEPNFFLGYFHSLLCLLEFLKDSKLQCSLTL